MSVITRFAPSPTGFLHIGGARTALFNYLFAAHHGGQYLVRIEDTDKKRSTAEAITAIHEGLSWLGLEGTHPPILQSQQQARHVEVAHEMLARGAAYKCYLSPDEIDAIREQAKQDKTAFRSPWREPTQNAPDAEYTIRLKMPQTGETHITDMVQGEVTVQNNQLDDMILLRSDQTPTYMLAVVVDDHDMGITHVIRGDDHLNNAFRQFHIYQAAGWNIPEFGHIPLIHGADGAKLSKRHGALGVDAYNDQGYLPEAIINYLARLGWSHGDDELFSLDQAISWFDGQHIGKSPSRFDFDKLKSVNQHWMRQADSAKLAEMVIARAPHSAQNHTHNWLTQLMPLFCERAQTVNDLIEMTGWLFCEGAPEPNEEAQAVLDDVARTRLQQFSIFMEHAPTNRDDFDEAFKIWMASEALKMKDIGLPLRAALTGTKTAPSIIDIVLALGAKEVKKRIQDICNAT
jgi:glutamyl-tRNA synthetase